MRNLVFVLAAVTGVTGVAGTGACNWTEFDNLADETWVSSTEKPDIKSSDYGIAIQRGARAGDGGRLVVLGAGTASYSELVYTSQGESSFPPTAVGLQELYGIPNIGQQPILIADPTNDNTSLIVTSDNGIAILTGAQGMLKVYQVFNQSAPDSGTYMLAPGQAAPQPLVAVGDVVFGAVLPTLPTGTPQPSCKLVDSTAPTTKLHIRALGVFRNGATDDVLAWDESGKLYKYPASVFNGCTPSANQIAAVDAMFSPDQGSQILAVDANTVLLQGHRGEMGSLRLINAMTMTAIGPASALPSLRTAAILDVSGTRYVIAGAPAAIVDGKTAAGQVTVLRIGATGLEVVATLNDAQPDANQSFGRGVAAMPFNGKQVIAVAADNEIFVYFRANLASGAALYDETRQGR